jgi:endonuclease YncB( thermonuclease family)
MAGRVRWVAAIAALAVALGVVVWPRPAHADPCTAPLPSTAGAEFGGVVRYVGDGDSLCVGPQRGGGETWIEVRLADFDAPEMREPGGRAARAALVGVAMGREIRCVATPGRSGRVRSYDRVIATCRLGGRRLGDLMRAAGVREGGN